MSTSVAGQRLADRTADFDGDAEAGERAIEVRGGARVKRRAERIPADDPHAHAWVGLGQLGRHLDTRHAAPAHDDLGAVGELGDRGGEAAGGGLVGDALGVEVGAGDGLLIDVAAERVDEQVVVEAGAGPVGRGELDAPLLRIEGDRARVLNGDAVRAASTPANPPPRIATRTAMRYL